MYIYFQIQTNRRSSICIYKSCISLSIAYSSIANAWGTTGTIAEHGTNPDVSWSLLSRNLALASSKVKVVMIHAFAAMAGSDCNTFSIQRCSRIFFSAFTGPILGRDVLKSVPHRILKSTNSKYDSCSASRIELSFNSNSG